jgi:hypothetical protein
MNYQKIDKVLHTSDTFTNTRKGNNLCPGKVIPQDIVDSLEGGLSIEAMLALENQGFSILTYKTQITVHGVWNYTGSGVVYKNLIQNGNKSLGVKYNAIDIGKKRAIAHSLRSFDNIWRTQMDSNGFHVFTSCKDMKDAEEIYFNFGKPAMEFCHGNIAVGQPLKMWGLPTWYIIIDLSYIMECDVDQFIQTLTGLTADQIVEAQAVQAEAERVKDEESKAYWAQRAEEENAKKRIKQAEKEAWIQQIASAMPEGYRLATVDDLKKRGTVIKSYGGQEFTVKKVAHAQKQSTMSVSNSYRDVKCMWSKFDNNRMYITLK